MSKIDIRSLDEQQLQECLSTYNVPKFRVTQVFDWLYNKGVDSFSKMSNIPKSFIEVLEKDFEIKTVSVLKRFPSKLDETVKFLYELSDGELTEGVLMKYKYGYTLCVSTQIGCKMGCKFCASTLNGCVRNLSASEILGQIYAVQHSEGVRISHIVLMGMGEPLDNYDNVIQFIKLATCEKGLNLSVRNISVSTCGVVPGIRKLMGEGLPVTLSISLHAPTNEIRDTIMPVNHKWRVEELLEVCKDYIGKTNRRISFEYSLISGVNDSDECARILANKLKGMLCHVNLIPVNHVEETPYSKSSKEQIARFQKILNNCGINATVRRTLGKDIDASCGQLRNRNSNKGGNAHGNSC